MMNICEYEDQYKIVEERLCPEHKQDVTMRCSTCMRTICVECLDDDTACYGISQLLFLFFNQTEATTFGLYEVNQQPTHFMVWLFYFKLKH